MLSCSLVSDMKDTSSKIIEINWCVDKPCPLAIREWESNTNYFVMCDDFNNNNKIMIINRLEEVCQWLVDVWGEKRDFQRFPQKPHCLLT